MERITLDNLVLFAKKLADTPEVYRPGMEVHYKLDANTLDLLQLEIHQHMTGSDNGFVAKKKFEFEVMDVLFKFTRS